MRRRDISLNKTVQTRMASSNAHDMNIYSFQLNTTPHVNTYSSRNSPPHLPIPPESFYSTPFQHRDTCYNPPVTPIPNSGPSYTPSQPPNTSPTSRKRKADIAVKENFRNYTPSAPHVPKKRKKGLSPLQKLDSVLRHIQSLNWSYSDYLFWSSEKVFLLQGLSIL